MFVAWRVDSGNSRFTMPIIVHCLWMHYMDWKVLVPHDNQTLPTHCETSISPLVHIIMPMLMSGYVVPMIQRINITSTFSFFDDILCISHTTGVILQQLQDEPFNYRLKCVSSPQRYLGANIGTYTLPDSSISNWYMSAEAYLARKDNSCNWGTVQSFEALFSSWISAPAAPNYHPELDQTNILLDDDIYLYKSYIRVLLCDWSRYDWSKD